MNQARDIFVELVDKVPKEQWNARLGELAGDDEALHAKVRALLAAHQDDDSFLESPAVLAATMDEPIAESPGTVIGHYKLLEQIGEGGFGVVFMAEQTEPVKRKVALKILKPGLDTKQVIGRFEAERQALAIMDHANIAHVYDAGATESGRPYFVMELVKGVPITEYCDEQKLDMRDRLQLFLQVCGAVQHAHQKGIIHRDIKPSNVIVSSHDGTPVVKVIDFGIAKAMSGQLTDKTLFTGFAQMMGTPLYMSPEQAGMSDLDVDTRSDIYSLGVLMYELLIGTTPFDEETLKKSGFDEMRRIIREQEPPRPSARISTMGNLATMMSERRQSDPRKLSQSLRGELDWIVMKCLEKDRQRRYGTAHSLALDLQRYMADEPVQACPPSTWYRLCKFARRNKALLWMSGTILVILVAAMSVLVGAYVEIGKALADKSQTLEELEEEQKKVLRATAEEKKARKLIEVREKEARWHLYKARMFPMMEAWRVRNFARLQQLLSESTPNPDEPDYRGWEWYYFQDQCNQASQILAGKQPYLRYCDCCWKTGKIAVITNQGTVDIWDADARRVEREIACTDRGTFRIVWSPGGDRLATSGPKGFFVWEAATGKLLQAIPTKRKVQRYLAWNPDGEKLALAEWDSEEIAIWDLQQKKVLRTIPVGKTHTYCLQWHPDGVRLAVGFRTGNCGVWNANTGERLFLNHANTFGMPTCAVAWSPDGTKLAASNDPKIAIYDDAGRVHCNLPSDGHQCAALEWSPDGSLLLSGGRDQSVRLWNVDSGSQIRQVRVHASQVLSVDWVPTGKKFLSLSNSSGLRLISLDNQHVTSTSVELTNRHHLLDLAWSPNGKWLACATGRTTKNAIMDARTGKVLHWLPGGVDCHAVGWSPDSAYVATLSYDGKLIVWDAKTGRTERVLECIKDGGNRIVAWSKNGKWLFAANPLKSAPSRLWRTDNWSPVTLADLPPAIAGCAFSPDSKTLAVSSRGGGGLSFFDLGSRQCVTRRPMGSARLAWSPDGRVVAAATDDGSLRFVRPRDGAMILNVNGHKGSVLRVCWSPDGRRIATGSQDRTIKIWDAVTLDELITIPCESDVSGLAWSPDSRRLACCWKYGMVHIWGSLDIQATPKEADFLETGILAPGKTAEAVLRQ